MTADQDLRRSLRSQGRLPGFGGATGWLNRDAFTPHGGQVTMVNFWTYTCINWLRQLPYLRAWRAKYESYGLTIIGVHTPEFSFEQAIDNVQRAVRELQITYPVVLDNDYAVWSAFANHYWPALYLADGDGHIRHHHFGEGGYQQTERIIRALLRDKDLPDPVPLDVQATGLEAQADWGNLRSGETYLGYARGNNFASLDGTRLGGRHNYRPPAQLPLNNWALDGVWTVTNEAATLSEAPGKLRFRFHARDLHLVMGPTDECDTVRFHVQIDEEPPGVARGADVDVDGTGAVTHQRVYQLVRQTGPIKDRTFEITFLDADVQVFAFTFG